MTKIVQTFYISTGAKNVMYTLRCSRTTANLSPYLTPDYYVRTLAGTEEKAIAKAREYFESFCDRIDYQETDDFVLILDDCPEMGPRSRRGKMSAQDTEFIEAIEEGIAPFGKHAGQKIVDLPESYILYFADMFGKNERPVMDAFAAACLGVALENGYIAKRDAKREERKTKDLRSNHVGKIDERIVIEGILEGCYRKESFDGFYYINKVRMGDDIFTYIGKELGEAGSTIKFRASIKAHTEYDGIKNTVVKRPHMLNS